ADRAARPEARVGLSARAISGDYPPLILRELPLGRSHARTAKGPSHGDRPVGSNRGRPTHRARVGDLPGDCAVAAELLIEAAVRGDADESIWLTVSGVDTRNDPATGLEQELGNDV